MIDILEDIEHDILVVSSCNRRNMYIQYPVKCLRRSIFAKGVIVFSR